ncbi:MAG: hypothetical protein OWQ50_10850 [Acidianus infernus]|nr:hypothetical protein [Acidianus infernus]
MATLFIVLGKAKPKTKEGDIVKTIDFSKYDLGDIPKLLALAKVIGSGKIDDAYKFLGVTEEEMKKIDTIKICMEDRLRKIVGDKLKKSLNPDTNLFSCE